MIESRFDTAPAYQQSQDYLGEGLQGDRKRIFLASKTHDRSREGSLRLLENSLRRLKTDHLDLWQLHDLREMGEVEQNVEAASRFQPLSAEQLGHLEERTRPWARQFSYFKRQAG